jgi:predicted Ser/Thr protein kinase
MSKEPVRGSSDSPLATTEPLLADTPKLAPLGDEASYSDVTQDSDTPIDSVAASPSLEALPHQAWERYRIVSFLGAGGMGAVYKAIDPRLNRSVAIKLLRSQDLTTIDERQRRQFAREARAQASIEHPHICKIYEVGEVQGQPYIAMQLIQGQSLHTLQLGMSREDKVRVVQKVAEALHAAHAASVIHRDIKPGNILIERRTDGSFWPYLMDFGLAREVDSNTQTSHGGAEGTPAFMAPEQARGEKRLLDARTDVYGLGATLYCALSGRPPFVGNAADVLLSLLLDDPPPLRTLDPAVPVALETLVAKCLEKEPARRYGSAQALAEDLGRFLEGARLAARPPTVLRRLTRFAQRRKLLVASLVTVLLTSLVLGSVALRIRWQATKQAALAQKLGQEIKDMEWLLRSSRQLQLHDLEREKVIVRKRMSKLSQELQGYGELSSGLAHYALGRGHMALHEYPQALTELQQAIAKGYQDGEVYYALGFVLGKHYEQAMADARLSGGGDWAKKQLKEIEPKYLTPAIAALQRSRSMKIDSPHYLDGLIAFYQRDYDGALKHADMALKEAPWLYEASKLAGDVHHERALQARDSGKDDDAKREFAAAVKSFEAAAAEGHSDAEVYEGLAEAWVRQIEMAVTKELPTDEAYAAAVAASDKITVAEPGSVSGPLKKAFAAMLSLIVTTSGPNAAERLLRCLSAAQDVFAKQPGHPYASDAASNCYILASEMAQQQGKDPSPFFRSALQLLEPVIAKYPHFLWGINDVGNAFATLGKYYQLHGNQKSVEMLQKSLRYHAETALLDRSYLNSYMNSLAVTTSLVYECRSEEELIARLASADRYFLDCTLINSKDQRCFNNYFQIYARAAYRTFLSGRDAQPRIQRALQHLALTRQLGQKLQDAEGHAAMTYLVQARDLLRKKLSPASSLALLDAALVDCLGLAPEDVMCRTLAAQAQWARADWQAAQHLPFAETLTAALAKARVAAESPEISPDAWQTLAETQLRIAQSTQSAKARTVHITDGLAALQKLFSINPNHALGLITQGQLLLLRAQGEQAPSLKRQLAADAAASIERALQRDPFLRPAFSAELAAAQALVLPAAPKPPSR